MLNKLYDILDEISLIKRDYNYLNVKETSDKIEIKILEFKNQLQTIINDNISFILKDILPYKKLVKDNIYNELNYKIDDMLNYLKANHIVFDSKFKIKLNFRLRKNQRYISLIVNYKIIDVFCNEIQECIYIKGNTESELYIKVLKNVIKHIINKDKNLVGIELI